jgi:hypothetical protein
MEDVPHRPDVCVTDVPRDDSVASERRDRELRPANRHPRTVNRELPPTNREPRTATIDPRPATIDPLPANIDPLTTWKRLNVYATDVPRDVIWRPSNATIDHRPVTRDP